jgi:hypothetical protein
MSLLSVVAFVPKGLFIDNIAKHMEIGGYRWCFEPGSGFAFNKISGSGSRSGSRSAKMTHKNRKSYENSCFEVLKVLF